MENNNLLAERPDTRPEVARNRETNRRRDRRIFLLLGITAALLSLCCLTGIMRESDQASLTKGAWDIYKTGRITGDYYNYDKQYGTYWIIASAFRIRSLFGGAWSPVFISDLCVGLTFWSATLFALFRLALRRRTPPLLALLCFLTTPVILINAVYANTAIVSAGFLILSVIFLGERRRLNRWLAALFFFVAVGTRADAILLLPLLVWLCVRPYRWLRESLLKDSRTWLMAAAAAGATGVGMWFYTGPRQYADIFDPMFHSVVSKTIPAYMVFGMGPSLVLTVLFVAGLLSSARHAKDGERKLFYLAGALSLALPLLYYSVQLYSPRYLVAATTGVLVFSVSPRGRAFWKISAKQPGVPVLRTIAAATAVIPLLVGVHLTTPLQPRLTISSPTLYPTTDGLHPMGAYGSFMIAMRDFELREVDHNQLIWRAASSARYLPLADGYVHLLYTPMTSYLQLAVRLDGLFPKMEKADTGETLYADSRSFMRIGSGMEGDYAVMKNLLAKPSTFVSPSSEGIGIVQFNAGGDAAWGMKTLLLNRLLNANEYRLTDEDKPGDDLHAAGFDGRPFVFISREPFRVSGRTASRDGSSGLYFVSGAPNPASPVLAEHPEQVSLAVQALPAWMSVAR